MLRANVLRIACLSLLLCASSAVLAQSRGTACEPPGEVRQALNALPNLSDLRVARAERLKPLLALVEKYPRDLFVQRRHQDTFRTWLHLHEEFDRAFAQYRRRPDDPVFRFLAARLTGSFHAQQAEQMLNELLAQHPDFPWPHLGLAELTERSGARNAAKAEAHLRKFLAACPRSIEGYALLRTVEDPELIRQGAARLRPLLEAQRDAWALPHWRHLWDLEFRAAPKEAQETVRQRVLQDAAALRRLTPAPTREWHALFDYAAQLTKEQSLRDWLEEIVLKLWPDSSHAARVERARWSRRHPRPSRDADAETHKAYAALEKMQLEELSKRFPNDADVIWDRWFQVMGGSATLPLEQQLAISDAYYAMMRRSPDAGSSTPPVEIHLANLYVKWHVRLEQVPGLIQAGLRAAELQQKYQRHPSMLPTEMRQQAESNSGMALTRWRASLVLADFYLQQRQFASARDAIAAGLADLQTVPQPNPRDAAFRRGEFLLRQARLALAEGDAARGLPLFREYLAALPRGILTARTPPAGELGDTLAEIKTLYLAQGGKAEAWLEWATAASNSVPESAWTAKLEYLNALPDFAAKDLNGKTWRLADLKGKATFIDVWATWCGPCRAEHPELQKFHEQIKARKDVQVLTFSVDETAYLAEVYAKEHKYTFPIIVSKDLTERLFPATGFPAGWVIDAQGRRSTYFRFPGAERALTELERAAAPPR